MKQPFFSIIFPVFKSERYVEFAIDDIKKQKFTNFETIIIDDCSPDNSIDIIRSLTKDDTRFKILRNKTNLGVSESRNLGLSVAKGNYIIFLDSDDRFNNELLSKNYNFLKRNKDVDITTWEFGGVDADNKQVNTLEIWRENEKNNFPGTNEIYNPKSFSDSIFQLHLAGMPMKCFSRKFIETNNIKFNNNIKFGEDALFSYKEILLAKNIYQFDDILYYYRRDQDDSAMHTIKFYDQFKDIINVDIELNDFLRENDIYDIYKDSFRKFIQDSIGAILYRLNSHDKIKNQELDEEISNILSSNSWQFVNRIKDKLNLK